MEHDTKITASIQFQEGLDKQTSRGSDALIQRRKFARQAICVFVSLVMYTHGVYGLLSICNDYTNAAIMGIWVFLLCVLVLSSEDTLANILAFTVGEEIQSKALCGLVDVDLTSCLGMKCFVTCCDNRRFYFLRFFYYNLNAFALSACWWGADTIRSSVTYNMTGYEINRRIVFDIALLLISNLVLISFKQIMNQFGVVGDTPVAHPADVQPRQVKKYSEANLILNPLDSVHVNSDTSNSLDTSLLGGLNKSHDTRRKCRDVVIKEIKVIFVFYALTMYWSATWDLLGSLPAEALVNSDGTDDDGSAGDDDYYDRHLAGSRRDEFLLLLLGLGYSVFSLIYLIATAQLFAALKIQNSITEDVSEEIRRKQVLCAIFYNYYFAN